MTSLSTKAYKDAVIGLCMRLGWHLSRIYRLRDFLRLLKGFRCWSGTLLLMKDDDGGSKVNTKRTLLLLLQLLASPCAIRQTFDLDDAALPIRASNRMNPIVANGHCCLFGEE